MEKETTSEEKALLAKIELELQPLKTPLGQAADTIVNENVSNYPVFVVHQQRVDIGLALIDKDRNGTKWSVNASTLEEFVTKNLIQPNKVDNFKDVFKPVKDQLCLFVLSELGATFVFLPRN